MIRLQQAFPRSRRFLRRSQQRSETTPLWGCFLLDCLSWQRLPQVTECHDVASYQIVKMLHVQRGALFKIDVFAAMSLSTSLTGDFEFHAIGTRLLQAGSDRLQFSRRPETHWHKHITFSPLASSQPLQAINILIWSLFFKHCNSEAEKNTKLSGVLFQRPNKSKVTISVMLSSAAENLHKVAFAIGTELSTGASKLCGHEGDCVVRSRRHSFGWLSQARAAWQIIPSRAEKIAHSKLAIHRILRKRQEKYFAPQDVCLKKTPFSVCSMSSCELQPVCSCLEMSRAVPRLAMVDHVSWK